MSEQKNQYQRDEENISYMYTMPRARSGVMKPEPFAWAYQNANTEHQYLVWHKQEGGRNWMPLFTQTDVQEAILAERKACIDICDKIVTEAYQMYRKNYDAYEDGVSAGARACMEEIARRGK